MHSHCFRDFPSSVDSISDVVIAAHSSYIMIIILQCYSIAQSHQPNSISIIAYRLSLFSVQNAIADRNQSIFTFCVGKTCFVSAT